MMRPIRDTADLRAIEARGIEAFLPTPTPYAVLQRAARLHPGRCAIHWVPSDGTAPLRWSFAELFDRVVRASALFRRLGATPDGAVALLMPHTPHMQVALWAAERVSRACPINPLLRADHIAAIVAASRATLAVVLGRNGELDVWDKVVPTLRAGGIACVMDADGDEASPGSDGSFADLVMREPAVATADPDPDAIASLFPTGGTTGAPKLTLHTHRNEAFVAAGAAAMFDIGSDDVMLNGFPLFHVAGAFVYGLSSVFAGTTQLVPGRLGLRNRPFVASMWRQVEAHGLTALGVVPTTLSTLVSQPVGDADISGLRMLLTGGSPLPTELADAVERNIGVPVRNILGMTECSGVVSIEPLHGRRTPGSTGLPLPFTALRVTDGVVAVRGPQVSPGYLDARADRGTFTPDGWLISGDLGHLDDSGRLFVTGRAKDVIIRGSHNIDPSALEDAMLLHPAIAVAAAIGQIDAYAGELPVVFVTLKPEMCATEAGLLEFIAAHVAEPAACPKRIHVVDELPLTPVGKIFKPALRARAARDAIAAHLADVAGASVAVDDAMTAAVITLPSGGDEAVLRERLRGMPIAMMFVRAP